MTTTKQPTQPSIRLWGYGRVSTTEQSTDNQLHELKAAGHDIKPSRWLVDVGVSGSKPAMQRPAFAKLIAKLDLAKDDDYRDALVVSKLDRLGRNAIDVMQTVDRLKEMGVAVRVLALDGTDLNSSAGRFMLQMLAAVAELERNMIRERTAVAQARWVADGGKLGRKPKKSKEEQQEILLALSGPTPETVSSVARRHRISRSTVIAIRKSGQGATTA